jgi:hypothetical protein
LPNAGHAPGLLPGKLLAISIATVCHFANGAGNEASVFSSHWAFFFCPILCVPGFDQGVNVVIFLQAFPVIALAVALFIYLSTIGQR